MILFWTLCLLVWLACGCAAYILFRNADYKWRRGNWTLEDRVSCGIVSLLFGPLALLIAFIRHQIEWDREVKW